MPLEFKEEFNNLVKQQDEVIESLTDLGFPNSWKNYQKQRDNIFSKPRGQKNQKIGDYINSVEQLKTAFDVANLNLNEKIMQESEVISSQLIALGECITQLTSLHTELVALLEKGLEKFLQQPNIAGLITQLRTGPQLRRDSFWSNRAQAPGNLLTSTSVSRKRKFGNGSLERRIQTSQSQASEEQNEIAEVKSYQNH